MKKIIRLAVCYMAVVVCSVVPMRAQNAVPSDRAFELSKNLEIFSKLYQTLYFNYVDDVDPGATMKKAIDAMLASLDPYTVYYPESDMEDVKLQLLGQYGGIGSLIHQQGDKIYISEPYKDLPADKAGLKAGDRILAVNGESTEGKSNADVSSAMRGQAGTELTLKLERDGKTFEKTITRAEIKLPNVPYSGMLPGNIGYVKLDEYTQDAAKNVRDAFVRLKRENPGMQGFVLDLRNNGGGLMNEAVDLVNIFVKRGQLIVETKGKIASKNTKSYTRMNPEDTEMPIAVLINGYSASASEITAGSLQDLDRAVIVGSRSFGKGLVQNVLPLVYNSQMKVTVSKYYIPSGRCIQALDYSHKDENGRATKVPDSLKTAFKTQNGRTVYDGFGIEPDIEVETEYMSALATTLISKFHIFNFVNEFVKKHPSIDPPASFVITDEIYDEFRRYLSDKDCSYQTSTEHILKELKDAAKEENYYEALSKQIDQLEEQLKKDKSDDLTKFRKEISELLKGEILVRYYYAAGRLEGSLVTDPDVLKACEVLHDRKLYTEKLKIKN
ncbi:MAG: PDZ domain-containing protein [Bacteroidales bacterium]|nr:PDZ domain-containing protein [Bacteroidales bacterium]